MLTRGVHLMLFMLASEAGQARIPTQVWTMHIWMECPSCMELPAHDSISGRLLWHFSKQTQTSAPYSTGSVHVPTTILTGLTKSLHLSKITTSVQLEILDQRGMLMHFSLITHYGMVLGVVLLMTAANSTTLRGFAGHCHNLPEMILKFGSAMIKMQ